jgi:hypothetical protein
MTWQAEVAKRAEAKPSWSDGVPFCSLDDCAQYDGKRCRALGFRPGNICEPVVIEMARLLVKRST